MADQKREIEYTLLVKGQALPEGFLEAYYLQLEKDLHHLFTRESSLHELNEQVAGCLEEEMESGKLEHLLYRIDLSEDYTAECLAAGNPLMELAQAIMKREAVKVMFRLQHSQGQS